MNTPNKTVRFALTRAGVWGQWTTRTSTTVRFVLTRDGLWWESTSGTVAPRPPRWRNVIAVAGPVLGVLNLAAHAHQQLMS
jgi:hypothetical protein